jgi:hypothetical protein
MFNITRRHIPALVAAAAVALAAAAAPAHADDPGATQTRDYGGYNEHTEMALCETPWRVGNFGQYGAWGNYIDGCTSRAWCSDYAVRCTVTTTSNIASYRYGQYTTLNTRLRRFNRSGALIDWQDASCGGDSTCWKDLTTVIGPGQSVSNQCNGVRQPVAGNYGRIRCRVTVKYLYS